MKKVVLVFVLVLGVWANEFKVKVGVSIAPVAYLVEKIGGKFVEIEMIVPPMKNPKLYQPSVEQVKKIKDLRIFIASGIPFEKKWLARFGNANPSIRILNLEQKDCKAPICYNWLSIGQVRKQAEKIAHLLRMVDIKNAQNYKDNLDAFLKELEALSSQIKLVLTESLKPKELISYQPVWSAYAKDFGIKDYVLLDSPKDLPRGLPILITPFDVKNQVYRLVKNSKAKLIVINPFAKEWNEVMLEAVRSINGK